MPDGFIDPRIGGAKESRGTSGLPVAMLKECTNCRHRNPQHANYCGRCGQAYDLADGYQPVPRRTSCGSGAGWLLLLVPVFLIFGPSRWQPTCVSKFRADRDVARTYSLPEDKADALFNLLAPRDVRVLVSRCEGGVCVKGTLREIEILDHLTGLLTRVRCESSSCIDHYMDQVRSSWTSSEKYNLSRHKASTLYHLLAFEDVPVGVSARKSKIRVDANSTDQATIRGVVNILAGKRRP
jgi:hypothetical protein